MSPSAAWVLSLITLLAPPARMAAQPSFPGHRETEGEWAAREASIAEDVAAVTADPREQAVLVAVAYHESAFARDVDLGPACYRGPNGDGSRCDGGRAASIWQIQAPKARIPELFADRRRAAAWALYLVRWSATKCVPEHGREGALRAFASGSCARGGKESADMVRLALRLLAERPPPKKP